MGSRRLYLNPCDYLYYTHARVMARRGQRGHTALMLVETRGQPPSDRVRQALAGAMALHASTHASLRISRVWGRPYWRLDAGLAPAERAAGLAYSYDDLRDAPDWPKRLRTLAETRQVQPWNLESGPNIRLEQYDLPRSHARFFIRWPHLLMDAEGAQALLGQIDSAALSEPRPSGSGFTPSASLRPGLLEDTATINPLADSSIVQKLRLFREGMALLRDPSGQNVRPLIPGPPAPNNLERILLRRWDAQTVQEMELRARAATPSGPARYGRFLAACVMRALHRLHTERGVMTDAYLLPLPMSVLSAVRHGAAQSRPIPGNYLVSPILRGLAKDMDDPRRLAESLADQLSDYLTKKRYLAQWATAWMASKLRHRMYRRVLERPIGFESLSAGFSYYGEFASPLRTFVGCEVVNFWGAGPMPVPPGWNPLFCRFQDRMNFVLTYNRPTIDDDLAARFADLIETAALGRLSSPSRAVG